MSTDSADRLFEPPELANETTWKNLIHSLASFARSLVFSYRVPSWKGQEEDIADDIVQETMRRIIERTQKSDRGEADPVHSLNHMTTIIAQNYCRDLRRRDCRLVALPPENYVWATLDRTGGQPPLFDAICEGVDQELLLAQIAREIANFPKKQRQALLIDLANRMYFDEQPTPLQQSFLEAGIQIEQYRQPMPKDIQERNQHASLLNHAYRRIAQLPCVQAYLAESLQAQAVTLSKTGRNAQKISLLAVHSQSVNK
jgi:DNA-directed RNA polymerase specialized sigma24 family protein